MGEMFKGKKNPPLLAEDSLYPLYSILPELSTYLVAFPTQTAAWLAD